MARRTHVDTGPRSRKPIRLRHGAEGVDELAPSAAVPARALRSSSEAAHGDLRRIAGKGCLDVAHVAGTHRLAADSSHNGLAKPISAAASKPAPARSGLTGAWPQLRRERGVGLRDGEELGGAGELDQSGELAAVGHRDRQLYGVCSSLAHEADDGA
jgi:hypothetical protein